MLCKQIINTVKYHLTRTLSTQVIIDRKIPVGNININYVQVGDGPKSVILMPGALGTAWTDFKPQIEKLPKLLPNHTIIAWDPPGYGKSRPPNRNFTSHYFEDDARYATKLMETLGRPKFSVMGWSDGGITSLVLTINYPDAVEKLIVWGSSSFIFEDEIKIFNMVRDVNNLSQSMKEPMEKLYGVNAFAKLWTEWVDTRFTIYKERKGDICRNGLEKIIAPTLILFGSKDPMLSAKHFPYLIKRIKGSEHFEFPDGKHNIHLRYPDEFNKIVAEFLNRS